MLKANNLFKRYGAREVLSDVSFTIEGGQRMALVGPNGSGKTTLLKILAGLEEPDGGSIETGKSAVVGYLPQDTNVTRNESVITYLRGTVGISQLEAEMRELEGELTDDAKRRRYEDLEGLYRKLGGYEFMHRAEVMLDGFGLGSASTDRLIAELSSGQKSKLALIAILLKGVDMLFLDEPTNNLDLPALIWLEDYLKNSDAAQLIVSHDRRLLDRIATCIMELDWHTHTLTTSGGTYSEFLLRRAKERERLRVAYRLQQEEIARLTKEARKQKAKAAHGAVYRGTDNDKFLRGFKRDRSAKSARKAKVIEKRIGQMDKIELSPEREPLRISLIADEQHGVRDIKLAEVVAGYQSGFQIGPITLRLPYRSRTGLLGLNGSGKSTLLKVIAGHLAPLSGRVDRGSGITIGDLMQEHQTLPHEETLFDFLKERTELGETDVYTMLVKFGFDRGQIRNPISTVSPGGRARLLLALFAAQSVNALVLDEPTNHLDIEALEALEEVLEDYRGTVVLVSHDRYFLEKITLDALYLIEDGVLTKLPSYREYVQKAEERAKRLLRLL